MFKFLKKSDFVDAYSKFLPYVKPYWFLAILGIILTAPVGALDAAVAWFLKPFMDNVMVEKEEKFTSWVPFIIVGFTILQGVFIYLSAWVNGYVGNKITLDIRRKLYKKLISMDSKYFDETDSGMILFRYFNDADNAASGLISNIKLFLTKFFSTVSLICVLIWSSWELSIIAIGVMLLIVFPMRAVRKKIKDIMTKTMMLSANILALYGETAGGNKVIQSYNLNKHMMDVFEVSAQDRFKMSMRLIKDTNWLSPLMHVIASVGVALVISIGGYLIVRGDITSGTFVSFLAALIMLYTPLKSIGNNYVQVQQSIIALGRIYEIFDTNTLYEKEEELTKQGQRTELKGINQGIEFRDVTFSYKPGRPVLNKISFKASKSQTIALVGNSGGGKSTICSLIPRLYDWESGEILIDGIDIRKYTLESLRSKIAYVFQDNFLFNTTVRENIMIANPDATEEELQNAIKGACIDEFINTLPNGLDSEIGERGTKLSGGQKQRVAIARAFIKNAPIVIMDEATSALDNKSEKIVQEALENLMKDRTVFVIAHRLSTIVDADKILVINDGYIVESGTHQELLAKNGAYASLYNTKAQTEAIEAEKSKTVAQETTPEKAPEKV